MVTQLHRNRSATELLRRIVRKSVRLAIEEIEKAIAFDDRGEDSPNESNAPANEASPNGSPAAAHAAAIPFPVSRSAVNGSAVDCFPPDSSPAELGPDKSIHLARQQIKRTRAGLRLLRAALGKSRYQRENMALRDAARPLTELRDARVLADTFATLEAGDAARLDSELRGDIDRYLIELQAMLRQAAPDGPAAHPLGQRLEPSLIALKAVHRRAARWPLAGRGWPAVSLGLKRAYRAGRAALGLVRRNPSVEQLHEWRKQAKYLRYQLEILEPMRPKLLGALIDQAHQIGNHLGDNHDLALLADITRRHFAAAPDADRLLAIIDHRRDQLAHQAVTIGMMLYRRRPGDFVKRLQKPWHAWRHG